MKPLLFFLTLAAAPSLDDVERRLEEGALSARDNAQAWLDKGLAHAALDQADQAQRAFAVALRIQRGLTPPAFDSELARDAFEAARDALPSDDEALDTRVVVVESGDAPGMSVQVEADDLGLVAGAELRVSGEVVSELQLSRSDPKARSPLHPGNVVGLLAVVFVDGYGNELRRVEIEGTAAPVADAGGAGEGKVIEREGSAPTGVVDSPQASSSGELRWLSLGGGTAMGVGAVGVAAAGMWLAALDAGDVDGPDGAREVALAGVIVGTAVVAIGGALVVTDLVMNPAD
jgi:hypothetical protein